METTSCIVCGERSKGFHRSYCGHSLCVTCHEKSSWSKNNGALTLIPVQKCPYCSRDTLYFKLTGGSCEYDDKRKESIVIDAYRVSQKKKEDEVKLSSLIFGKPLLESSSGECMDYSESVSSRKLSPNSKNIRHFSFKNSKQSNSSKEKKSSESSSKSSTHPRLLLDEDGLPSPPPLLSYETQKEASKESSEDQNKLLFESISFSKLDTIGKRDKYEPLYDQNMRKLIPSSLSRNDKNVNSFNIIPRSTECSERTKELDIRNYQGNLVDTSINKDIEENRVSILLCVLEDTIIEPIGRPISTINKSLRSINAVPVYFKVISTLVSMGCRRKRKDARTERQSYVSKPDKKPIIAIPNPRKSLYESVRIKQSLYLSNLDLSLSSHHSPLPASSRGVGVQASSIGILKCVGRSSSGKRSGSRGCSSLRRSSLRALHLTPLPPPLPSPYYATDRTSEEASSKKRPHCLLERVCKLRLIKS